MYLAPSLRWRPDAADEVMLRADLHQRAYRSAYGLPGPSPAAWTLMGYDYAYPGISRERMGLDLPASTYLGLPDWDQSIEHTNNVQLEWSHDFGDAWRVKLGVAPEWTHYHGRYSWWSWSKDDATGVVSGALSAGIYGYRSREVPVSIDVTGEFTTWGIVHTLLVGAGADAGRYVDAGPGENQAMVPLEAVGSLDWLHPPHYALVQDTSVLAGHWTYDQHTRGAYIQDIVKLDAQWRVLGGYRIDTARGSWTYDDGSGPDGIYTGSFGSHGGTPRLGVVFEPSRVLSLYASLSRSFSPNWGRLVDGSLPPPERGRQQEIGLKWDFDDGRANLNVAAYRLYRENVERCAPQSADCKLYVLSGQQQSQGIEFDLNGQVFRHLRVTSALTFQTGAKITRDLPYDPDTGGGGLPIGTHLSGGPHVLFNVFGVVDGAAWSMPALSLGLGFNATSRSEMNVPNDGQHIAGARQVDLFAAYEFSPRTRVQLNVNNLSGHVQASSPGWQNYPWIENANTPREFVLTMSTRM